MELKHLKIDNKLQIPVYFFHDKPKVLLLAGIHGDEKSGPLILKKLITSLKNSRGNPVAILPVANPEAYQSSSRTNPQDRVDLNRIFPVKEMRSRSCKIAKVIQEFAGQFEVIIDLHAFTKRRTLICGVETNSGNREVKNSIKKLMSSLNLDAICRIDKKTEPSKKGSLCGYLQGKGKLAFGVELPDFKVLTNKEKRSIIRNLGKFPVSYKTALSRAPERNLRTYARQIYTSKSFGRFYPLKNIGANIKRSEVMGKIITANGMEKNVQSPFEGVLISISFSRKIKKGEKIFVVGEIVR